MELNEEESGTLFLVLKTVSKGRIAETDDVVGAVFFLASGLSDFITREIITVDGGSRA